MINFHLPDFYNFSYQNSKLLHLTKDNPIVFHDGLKIATVYGAFPSMIWEGGRRTCGAPNQESVAQITEFFNRSGVGLKLTLTNPKIEGGHLTDEWCNRVLSIVAKNPLNEAVIYSPILRNYIKKEYPQLRLISSTSKLIGDIDSLNSEIEKYDMVVLSSSLNKQYDKLTEIKNKNKVELLVNSYCVDNCKFAKQHYDSVGDFNLGKCKSAFKCPYNIDNLSAQRGRGNYISYEQIKTIYEPLGFKHFKLDGRGFMWDIDGSVVDNYIEYLIKSEYKQEVRNFLVEG